MKTQTYVAGMILLIASAAGIVMAAIFNDTAPLYLAAIFQIGGIASLITSEKSRP